jgi:hypothetical protein
MAKQKSSTYIPAPDGAGITPEPRWTRTLIDGSTAVLFDRESHRNRESWAGSLVDHYRGRFAALGAPLPAHIRVGIGFPRGSRGTGKGAIGMAYAPTLSADGASEVTVSPTLADPVEVAQVVIHELCHHAAGCEHGHKGPFAALARPLGLAGRLTATVPSDELRAELAPLLDLMGVYPHARLSGGGKKPQTTRMLKAACPSCGYTVRLTAKWAAEGMPVCPCGEELQLDE